MLHKHGRFGGVIIDMRQRIVSIQDSNMIERVNPRCCILNIQQQSLPLVIACAINIVQYSIFLQSFRNFHYHIITLMHLMQKRATTSVGISMKEDFENDNFAAVFNFN